MSSYTPTVGDRVKYTGSDSPCLNGEIGTVKAVRGINNGECQVKWDSGKEPRSVFVYNVTLLKPTDTDIKLALEVLRAAGVVEFKPFKPPFKPVYIIVNSYTAMVTDKGVTIGCQSFKLHEMNSLLNQLSEAVEAAIVYNWCGRVNEQSDER